MIVVLFYYFDYFFDISSLDFIVVEVNFSVTQTIAILNWSEVFQHIFFEFKPSRFSLNFISLSNGEVISIEWVDTDN